MLDVPMQNCHLALKTVNRKLETVNPEPVNANELVYKTLLEL